MKTIVMFVLALSLLVIAGCAPHVDVMWPAGKWDPNAYEKFYIDVAGDFGDARPCEKISNKAIEESPSGDMGSKWEATYAKSMCYFDAAMTAHNPTYCDSVKSITVIPSNESIISKSTCLEVVAGRVQLDRNQPLPGDYVFLEKLMKDMGFRPPEIVNLQYALDPNDGFLHEFYDEIKNRPAFRKKVEGLPDYAKANPKGVPRPANNDEILMQMVALDDHIPALCRKISPEAYGQYPFPEEPTPRFSLRDECFFYSAEYATSVALCKEIPRDIAPSTPGNVLTREACEKKVETYKLRHWRVAQKGVPLFSTGLDFAAALESLGYRPPFLSKLTPLQWLRAYTEFEVAQPDEREKFLDKVEGLPSFKR